MLYGRECDHAARPRMGLHTVPESRRVVRLRTDVQGHGAGGLWWSYTREVFVAFRGDVLLPPHSSQGSQCEEMPALRTYTSAQAPTGVSVSPRRPHQLCKPSEETKRQAEALLRATASGPVRTVLPGRTSRSIRIESWDERDSRAATFKHSQLAFPAGAVLSPATA
ncbi:hypothetical protein FOMPIDRAFT_161107 [Fomitopsis schrenkii]|uniref:Uncharacterized protein n=1 Tax=Fomitopsis schrenkii TaxID=2126942 RepID=S8DH13_FOMSC|nr:hypothetical protein FOMPIDRAFT_161107 [Fomitopsis schrenkii]